MGGKHGFNTISGTRKDFVPSLAIALAFAFSLAFIRAVVLI